MMDMKRAASLLKGAKSGTPKEFYEAAYEAAEALSVQEMRQSVQVLAALVRDEELGLVELSRKGVFEEMKRMAGLEAEYLGNKK